MAVDGAIVPPDPPVVKLIFVNLSGEDFGSELTGLAAKLPSPTDQPPWGSRMCTRIGARMGGAHRPGARRLRPLAVEAIRISKSEIQPHSVIRNTTLFCNSKYNRISEHDHKPKCNHKPK